MAFGIPQDQRSQVMLLIIVGGARRWYVYNWTYRELAADRDYWRRMALAGGSLAEKAVDAAKGDG